MPANRRQNRSEVVRCPKGAAASLPVLLLLATPLVATDEGPGHAGNLGEAVTAGTFSLSLRYRFEWVADDAPPVGDKDGLASTLRTTLRYETLPFHGVSVLVEAEDVTDMGLRGSHDNAGAGDRWNGITDRPVIPDPDLTEINQAYLRIVPGRGLEIRGGRQEINVDNQRFVGAVAWRQNHQAFDAALVTWSPTDRLTATYGYLDAALRIFGDTKAMASHLVNVGYSFSQAAKLTAYGYRLDYDMPSDRPHSTDTHGLRLAGTIQGADGWSLPYAVEAARQKDAADNPNQVEAAYYHGEVSYRQSGWRAGGGFEVLEGAPDTGAFSTPLATLHKFNGWADKFLRTPENGLVDLYLLAGYATGGWQALAVYHHFSADTGKKDYGRELDVELVFKAPWKQTFGLEAALYRADDHAADTTKLWLWTGYGF